MQSFGSSGDVQQSVALPLTDTLQRNDAQTVSPQRQRYLNDALKLGLSLAVVLIIAFAPYFFGGKTLLASSSDVPSIYPNGAGPQDPGMRVARIFDAGGPGWAMEPWLALSHRLIFDEHNLPMWNPYNGYGTPFAAAMQGAPFFPLSFLAAIHPAPWTYNFLVVGRLFVLAYGVALFVRLFTGFPAALVAGICAAFSGYFLLFLDIGHLGVEVMLPWTLLGLEVAARRPSPRSAALLAAAWGLTVLGGMPESTALAGLVITSYLVFRIVTTWRDAPVLPRLLAMGSGLAIGTMIAGLMVVPFLEYAGRDFDIHQSRRTSFVGMGVDAFTPHALLTEFAALAFGPPWNNILSNFAGWSGVRGAPGTLAIFFACLAVVSALWMFGRRALIDRVALFMAVAVILLEAKRFGAPVINWIGALPVLRLIEFQKYGEAPVAVLCACLAGFGVAALLERRTGFGCVIVTIIGVLGTITWLFTSTEIPVGVSHERIYYLAVGLVLAVFAATSVAAVNAALWPHRRAVLGLCVAGIALLEGVWAYLIPIYYIIDKPASNLRNAYAGAAYISYLQGATSRDGGRIVGTAGDLFPDWASAFGLYDARDLDAMYPERYIPFVAGFLFPVADDLDGYDRFTGSRTIDFGSAPVRRWMSLSSIEYIVSAAPILSGHRGFLGDLWAQTAPTIPAPFKNAVQLKMMTVNGTSEFSLFEHPPYANVVYASTIARGQPWLAVDVTLDPRSWTMCGGAVTFAVDALDAAGRSVRSVVRTIDPKKAAFDRRWARLTLDLRSSIGRRITLRFATSAAPPGDTCAAWAYWGDPRWTPTHDTAPYRELATPGIERITAVNDAFVYRVAGALPRLALFHYVERASTADEAFKMLTDPQFNVRRTAVVEGDVPDVSGDSRADRVNVLERTSQRVAAEVTTAAPALLLQNDTAYPGWKATLDGRDAPILVTDYLFRGVAVPAGHHHVVIEYRSTAVSVGLALSIAGAVLWLGLCGWGVGRRRIRRARP